jgi:hypothetical protein
VAARLPQSSAAPRCARRRCPAALCGGRQGRERRGDTFLYRFDCDGERRDSGEYTAVSDSVVMDYGRCLNKHQ